MTVPKKQQQKTTNKLLKKFVEEGEYNVEKVDKKERP